MQANAHPVSKIFNPLCTFRGAMVYDARVPRPIVPNVLISLKRDPLTRTCMVLEQRHYSGMTKVAQREEYFILRTGLLDHHDNLREYVDVGKIPAIVPARRRHRVVAMSEFVALPGAVTIGGCVHCHQYGIYVVGADRYCSRHRHLAYGSTFNMALLTAATPVAATAA
jgi:hypothetical protein